jgi:hypothetical protein
MHIGKEVREHRKSIGLEAQRESPKKMGVIIQNNEIIFKSGYTDNGRGP